MKLVVLTLES